MAEITDLLSCKRAFFGPKFELGVAEPLDDLSEADKVLLPGGGEYDDVVELEEVGLPMEPS